MALDAQGAGKARPYVEKAHAEYINLVDEDNLLGSVFGFKAIPNGVFVDEAGVVRYTRFGGFDIRDPQYARLAEQFAASESLDELERQAEAPGGFRSPDALDHLRRGLALYREGQVQEALAEWRKGVELEPDNWIIRKQVWAVENPQHFYGDKVNFDWQREQVERGL